MVGSLATPLTFELVEDMTDHAEPEAMPEVNPGTAFTAINIDRAIARRGFTQSQFGELTGVSARSVRGWISGQHLPSGETALKVCEILGLDPTTIPPAKRGGTPRPLVAQHAADIALIRRQVEGLRHQADVILEMLDRQFPTR